MCEPTTIAATMAVVSTVAQGYSAYQQGKFEKGVAEYNARQLENEATQTRNVGTEREMEHREKVQQLIGQQSAAIGASGVTFSGSAAGLLQDTALQGEVDALRIRSNFQRQAQSLDDQAGLTKAEGKAAAIAGRNAFAGSLLSAAGTAAGAAGGGGNPGTAGLSGRWYSSNSVAMQGQTNPLFNNTAYVKRY